MVQAISFVNNYSFKAILQFLITLSGLSVLIALGSVVGTTLPPKRIDLTSFLLIATIILLVLSNRLARLQPYQWILLITICILSGITLSQLRLIENSPCLAPIVCTSSSRNYLTVFSYEGIRCDEAHHAVFLHCTSLSNSG
jgi:hypothetical protein